MRAMQDGEASVCWHDQEIAIGKTNDPSKNAGMTLPVFSSVSGRDFKITRCDDIMTLLCYRPQVTVWLNKDHKLWQFYKWQKFGPVANALEIFSVAVSTRQPTGFNRLSAVGKFKAHYLFPFHVSQFTTHIYF